jgi:hypothetical protein
MKKSKSTTVCRAQCFPFPFSVKNEGNSEAIQVNGVSDKMARLVMQLHSSFR